MKVSDRELDEFFDAIYHGDCKKVRDLLARGFSANQMNREGETALVYAASHGKDECVQALLDHGAAFETLPMVEAAVSSDPTVMRRFLSMGGNPNVSTDKGQTPLMQAAFGGNKETVALLLEHGADPQKKSHSGYDVLDASEKGEWDCTPEEREEVLSLLREAVAQKAP